MTNWYYAIEDRQFGPVPEETLRSLIANGTVRGTDAVWRKGFADWVEVNQVAELRSPRRDATTVTGVYLEGSGPERYPIPEGQTTVGRGEENDIVLPAKYVSILHAIFENLNGLVWLSDLGSRNGTYRNGVRLFANERIPLAPDDEIKITEKGWPLKIRGNRDHVTKPVKSEPVPLVELQKEVAGQKPAPLPATIDAVSAPTKENTFGFQDTAPVEFFNLGVGKAAAVSLAKRFKPISLLSQGGMGKIILAQDVLAGRFVAVKIMLERIVGSNPHVHQFIREAVITARLQHPHIIPVYDLGFFTDNQLFYTMRYVDGKDYGRVRDDMDLLERVRVLRCASLAVDHAHSLGLWHRDLKPNNILVGPLGDTYVIDWGLVSVQPGGVYKLEIPKVLVDQQAIIVPDSLLEQTGDALTLDGGEAIMGTPAYMSPEQARRMTANMGAVSDVWPFGVMLYEAVAERHPLEQVLRGRTMDLILALTSDQLIDPLPDDAPPALVSLCKRMLERDPNRRMKNLRDFIRETGHFLRRNSKYV